MRYLTADCILPISTDPIKEGVLILNDSNQVEKIAHRSELGSVDIEYHKGILIPGFINTHCHLELSHMKGLCKTGTKLIPFISDVVKLREFEIDVIKEKIREEDENMYNNGIQAVGDICNKTDTAEQKAKSKINYYSFVEMFDFLQGQNLRGTVENYRAVFAAQDDTNGNKKSFVPHAPYSVSPELFQFINEANPSGATISMHNQETLDEHLLFLDGTGGFKDFYKGFGVDMSGFKPNGQTSIYYALQHMVPKKKNIFVHNTLTAKEDILAAQAWSENVYWSSCPNANFYIENKLPNYKHFMEAEAKVCLGTDSIMSNWTLSIWDEIKTIKKFQSYVPLNDLLKWGTINGAEALGYQKSLGSFEKGKAPGVINIELNWVGEETNIQNSQPNRII